MGITRKREMDRLEFQALVKAQNQSFEIFGVDTCFSAEMICRMHRDWLGSIYRWAGGYRTVDVSKGDFTWPPAERVPQNMRRFEEQWLARLTPTRGGIEEVSRTLAIVHAELLLIHPFRDGNGRLARWLATLMAVQAGLAPPRYHFSGRGRMERSRIYLYSVQQGYIQNYEPLTNFFLGALTTGAKSASSD